MRSNPTIFMLHPPLNKEQMRDAFSVTDSNPLWLAITETILTKRADWQANEAAATGANNPLALAAAAGAVDALENLLNDLELKRNAANR